MKVVVKICVFCTMLMLGNCLGGCSKKKERPVMNIDFVQKEDGTKAMVKNGKEQNLFQVADGEEVEVKGKVTKEEGTINVKIYLTNDPENILYEADEFPEENFNFMAEKIGDYTIMTEVKDFVGEYSFNFSTIK